MHQCITEVKRFLRKAKQLIDWRAVGRRVRQLRGFDMTQKEFAEAIGVSQGQLSRIERGESQPRAEVLLRLSRVCKKSVNWILTAA